MRIPALAALLLALTACPPTTGEDDTGDPFGYCRDVNEDGEAGHPGREFYLNNDGDNYGDEPVFLCNDPFDSRPDDYSPLGGDCDDNDDDIHPDAAEMCDGVDNDCDGEIDVDALDAIQWHVDEDGDGYGDAINGPAQCSAPVGHVTDNTDCDDGDATVNPDTVWYLDGDHDGYGDPGTGVQQCPRPTWHVSNGDDCDDGNDLIFPGTQGCP